MAFELRLLKQLGNARYAYFFESRNWRDEEEVSEVHKSLPLGELSKNGMVESMVFYPRAIEAMGLPPSTPSGVWVGFRVSKSVHDSLLAGTPGTYALNKSLSVVVDSVTKSQPKEPRMTYSKDDLYLAAMAADKSGDREAANALYNAWRAMPKTADIAKAVDPPASDPLVKDVIHETVMAVAEIESLHPRNASRSMTDIMLDVYKSKDGALLYDLARSPYGMKPLTALRNTVAKSRGELSGVESALRALQTFQSNLKS